MNPRRNLPAFAACVLAACASTTPCHDLARNDDLYRDVPFTTKAPGDRAVFVAPLVDARDPSKLPTRERGFPITYGNDQVWERPVVEMVGEVLQRQVASSHLFPRVVDTATPETLVLQPTLVSFVAGASESIGGAQSFAEVGLRLQVFGPADADGKRSLWFDHLCADRQLSERSLRPVSPYRLLGRALFVSMGKALAGLDGSNVGRSNVPVAAPAAAPAAAPSGR